MNQFDELRKLLQEAVEKLRTPAPIAWITRDPDEPGRYAAVSHIHGRDAGLVLADWTGAAWVNIAGPEPFVSQGRIYAHIGPLPQVAS